MVKLMLPLEEKRIFYVEDNVSNLALVQMILEQQGAKVYFERWGDETDLISRLQSCMPINLILLDLMFAGNTNGYDLFDNIRQIPDFNLIPIAMLSAADPSIEMPKARAKGFTGYISKPVKLTLFPQQVADLINGQHVWYAG
ncbi:MAG: response regulator [Chloroflexi bacterium]|nr:response regulator [Chloroflexota bacterium]